MEVKLENIFDELRINDLLEGSDNLPDYKLASKFRKISKEIENDEKNIILGALEHLCTNFTSLDNLNFGEKHNEICRLFTKKIESINNSVLKGIVGEMLFKLENNYNVLGLTIDSYIESFKRTFCTEDWVPCFNYIVRALNISKKLGKKNDRKDISLETMYTKLKESYSNDKLYLSREIIKLLISEKYGKSLELYNICIDRADVAEKERDFNRSRAYLELCTKNYITNDNEKKNIIRRRIVRTYEENAKYELEVDKTNYFVAVHHIEKAIEASRNIQNNKAKTEELLKLMMYYQGESAKHMTCISSKVEFPKEMSDQLRSKVDLFKGKEKQYVLKGFAILDDIPEKEAIKEQVKEEQFSNPLQNLINSVMVNEKGKNIAKYEGTTPGEQEMNIENKMYSKVKLYINIQTTMLINRVREVIISEHSISENDLYEILDNHNMIPKIE